MSFTVRAPAGLQGPPGLVASMAGGKGKTVHEAFARFFEEPTRESLRSLFQEHVGELRNCDFKQDWPKHGAAAKHILGLANAGGGCLIVGVAEDANNSLVPHGMSVVVDKADVINGLEKYLPSSLISAIELADFTYRASEYPDLVGKSFQALFVHSSPDQLPYVAQLGGEGIRRGAIYVRHDGKTAEASHDDVERLIRERLDAEPRSAEARDLKDHLEELRVLFSQIPRTLGSSPAWLAGIDATMSRFASLMAGEERPNPRYPAEDFVGFVSRMIDAKKRLIEKELGVHEQQ